MSSAMGVIFSNIHDSNLPELTMNRTLASIPFFGRYRLVDFALSNMVNSGITKVGVITKSNYQSLMDHIGSGKDWDLARRHGGLRILPPFGVQENSTLYNSRLEALKGILGFIAKSNEEYIVMTDCDIVCNLDFNTVIDKHIKNKADITLVYHRANLKNYKNLNKMVLKTDAKQRITDIAFDPRAQEEVNMFANIFVLSRTLLINLVIDAIAHNKHHFGADIIAENVNALRIFGFEHRGYFVRISSLLDYYTNSLALLEKENRDALFENNCIFTKVRDSAPTKYGAGACVSNSIIADGCEIEGTVENSVIFRGTKIKRGAVIKNSILMQDAIVCENALVNCIIADKNVVIKDRRQLSGCLEHPFFINKNSIV